jgi:hypothetical protein
LSSPQQNKEIQIKEGLPVHVDSNQHQTSPS